MLDDPFGPDVLSTEYARARTELGISDRLFAIVLWSPAGVVFVLFGWLIACGWLGAGLGVAYFVLTLISASERFGWEWSSEGG